MLQALGVCASLTDVALYADEPTPWDLTPLLQLKQLRKLKLKGRPDAQFDEHAIAVVKQMASLESLAVGDQLQLLDNAWLIRLCQPPHRLQRLQEIDLSSLCLGDADMQALRHLPTLTTLEPFAMHASDMATLAHFPSLRRLRIMADRLFFEDNVFFDGGRLRAFAFLPHLTCTRLQVLTFEFCDFTEEEAEMLCQLLPQLTELTLSDVGWPSLEPLRHLKQLAKLSLTLDRRTTDILTLTLPQLQALKSLQELTLQRIHPPLDAATVAQLQPPSLLMPSLKSFNYTPRSD